MRGETLFVVLSGKAKVTRNGRKVGEVLPGDFFGELSALDGGPRSATVAAETPVRVLRVFRHTLVEMVRDEPGLILKLLDGIVRRLREVDRQLNQRID
jgi:CRP-like cAMP-binding protein